MELLIIGASIFLCSCVYAVVEIKTNGDAQFKKDVIQETAKLRSDLDKQEDQIAKLFNKMEVIDLRLASQPKEMTVKLKGPIGVVTRPARHKPLLPRANA